SDLLRHFYCNYCSLIFTLSLHDALPISEIPLNSKKCLWLCFPWRPCKRMKECLNCQETRRGFFLSQGEAYVKKHALDTFVTISLDRKSTRLNSSHVKISYAVFCLKKKTI